jgi:hypothetical protein
LKYRMKYWFIYTAITVEFFQLLSISFSPELSWSINIIKLASGAVSLTPQGYSVATQSLYWIVYISQVAYITTLLILRRHHLKRYFTLRRIRLSESKKINVIRAPSIKNLDKYSPIEHNSFFSNAGIIESQEEIKRKQKLVRYKHLFMEIGGIIMMEALLIPTLNLMFSMLSCTYYVGGRAEVTAVPELECWEVQLNVK